MHQVRDWYSGAAAYFGRMSDKAAGQKTRGPEGCGENGPAAALLLGHVSIQICFLVPPCRRPILIATPLYQPRTWCTRCHLLFVISSSPSRRRSIHFLVVIVGSPWRRAKPTAATGSGFITGCGSTRIRHSVSETLSKITTWPGFRCISRRIRAGMEIWPRSVTVAFT